MNMYLIGAWMISFTVAPAQDKRQADSVSRQLSEVDVVAQPRVSVARQAAPLQALDYRSMARLGIRDLSEAVRRFSGVTVKDYGGIGGLKTVSIRSLGAHHTVVDYDGVAISDAQSGQVDVGRFTTDQVEMVSLSVGQGDDIFRTARIYASAGAIHIKTSAPRLADGKAYRLTAKIRGGSFGLANPVLSYARKLHESLSASVHADYMRADGNYPYMLTNGTLRTREKRWNSDVETFRMEGNVYGDFGRRGGRLEAKLYSFHSARGLPGSVRFYGRRASERLWNDNSFVQARYRTPLSGRVAVQAVAKYAYAYSRYKDVNDNYAAGYQEDRNTQHEYYASAGVLYTSSGYFSASFTTDYAHTNLHNNFPNAVRPVRNTALAVCAVQYKSRSLTATGSLLGTWVADEASNNARPSDHKRLSPAAAFSWQPFQNSALRVRASYKDIFRTPTFTDLYYLRIGNTGLRPEKAKQYNAGLTWSGSIGRTIRYLSFSADGYYNRVEDKIVALPTLYIWRMMNMGEVGIKGLDVNLSAEMPLPGGAVQLFVSGSYTYQYAIDVTNPDAKNYRHQIPYTPRHSGNGAATVETPWVNVSFLLTAVGERYALPQNTKVNRIDAYTEQSVSLSRTFTGRTASVSLQGEAVNLAGAHYDVIQYYPMPGRSWRVSITVNI